MDGAVLSLTTAAAVFHATEYLAVVTHYACRRQTQGNPAYSPTWPRLGACLLAVYVLLLGLVAATADAVNPPSSGWASTCGPPVCTMPMTD